MRRAKHGFFGYKRVSGYLERIVGSSAKKIVRIRQYDFVHRDRLLS